MWGKFNEHVNAYFYFLLIHSQHRELVRATKGVEIYVGHMRWLNERGWHDGSCNNYFDFCCVYSP